MSGRALISVWEKEGVEAFARGLRDLGFELVSSGGTAAYLEEQGLPVTRVEEVTAAPEMLGGRVKTLHPRIHAGILARRDLDEDVATLAEHEIEPFDVVCVNLYPFTSVASRIDATEAETVEMIDVGGPSMLRAAAKNFAHVAAVSANASAASVRLVSSETVPVSCSSARTGSYWDGRQIGVTCAKFFAAPRSIDGPPMSIISTASSSRTPCRATTRLKG